MKSFKTMKRNPRHERENQILLGLIDLYIKSGKPIGSNTLKESGFPDLSSATIRNYFSKLEASGYLKQQHSSGGRTPTDLAYKLYATSDYKTPDLEKRQKDFLKQELMTESREIVKYLTHVANTLSDVTSCPVFLSAPRFDQDFIVDIKLVGIDQKRCLCVIVTDFGLVHSEILYTTTKLSNFSLKRIESYFHFRMTGLDKPTLSEEELALSLQLYNEIMLRHIVGYANFSAEDLYKAGFSKLLDYQEFRDAATLANALALFENPSSMRALLRQSIQESSIHYWIGEDLEPFTTPPIYSSVITVPYFINQKAVGALGVLGPTRMPYRKISEALKTSAQHMSENLTSSMYKFQISFREPKPMEPNLPFQKQSYLEKTNLLLEDHRDKT